MGKLLMKAVQLTRRPLDRDEIRYKNGDTFKIIEVTREADDIAANERVCKDFAPLLRGRNDFETCRNTWNFMRYEIPYVADKIGYERIRLPNKCIWDAARIGNGGDCKTFYVTTADLLRENGIASMSRFIAQRGGNKAKHVYCIAKLQNGLLVPCDAVYHSFNIEPPYTMKWDFDAAQLVKRQQATDSKQNAVSGLFWF